MADLRQLHVRTVVQVLPRTPPHHFRALGLSSPHKPLLGCTSHRVLFQKPPIWLVERAPQHFRTWANHCLLVHGKLHLFRPGYGQNAEKTPLEK